MLRTLTGFVLLVAAIALLLLIGSVWPPPWLAVAGGIAAAAIGAAGLRILWRPAARR